MTVSVIVPAHNEERTISRLLGALADGVVSGELEVIVVCNGCTDGTADAARRAMPQAVVVESLVPSKASAQCDGDELASSFPRLYVDADVVVDTASIRLMAAALADTGILACAPERRMDRTGTNALVRWYYDVWEELPQVRDGLFGRGVLMVSREGYGRIRSLPPAMSDDLVMSEAFTPDERLVVPGASVTIRTPRSIGDLLRRRIRVVTGNAQAESGGLRGDSAKTSVGSLMALARHDRGIALRIPVFLAVTLVARSRAARLVRRGDYTTWLRDESSRN